MKKLLPVLVLAAVVAGRVAAEPMTIDGYAAIVNDHVITVGEVLEFILPVEEQLRINYAGRELAAKRTEAFTNGVQRLVEQQLIVEDFKKNGGSIPERLVNDRVNEVINDRFHNNRADFLKALAEQHITLDEWRDGIRSRLIASMLRRQEVTDKLRITPADIREAYEKQKAARFATTAKVKLHVIVMHKGIDAEIKRQDAVLLRGKIIGGEKFEDMARQHSEGMKADKGGDWGWLEEADLRPEIKNGIVNLKAGELSEVVDAGDDFFVIKLDERKTAGVQSFDEVRQQIEDELRQAEGERLFSAWIERLKLKHNVHVFPASST